MKLKIDPKTRETVKANDANRRAWRTKNGDAIANYNERIRKHGCFSDGLRQF